MSRRTQSTLESLRLVLHGVTSPFACEGTVAPEGPVTIAFKDRTRFEVVRAPSVFDQKNLLKPLLERCQPAPFGDGKTTRYDRRVRDAFQLKAESGSFQVENFDLGTAGILKKVRRQLVPHDPNPLSAELYTLNVYTEGGHFARHKDTPRGSDMLGTLVVCLPSVFSHGRMVLSHRGVVRTLDWGRAIESQRDPTRLHWVAFFGDVDHQIETVWTGARVTVTYLLRRGTGAAPAPDAAGEDLEPRVRDAWRALLADGTFLPNGGTLGYPCCHLYQQDARFQRKQRAIDRQSLTTLKGRDHLVAATGLQAGLKGAFVPYMFENCADETWQLEHFPTRQEKSRLAEQMDETALREALPIRASSESAGDFGVTWLEPPPSSGSASPSDPHRDPELPAAAHLHSCDYCPWGYFGNESSEVDLYTFAALHFEIPPFGRGPRAADNPKPRPVARRRPPAGKRPSGRA